MKGTSIRFIVLLVLGLFAPLGMALAVIPPASSQYEGPTLAIAGGTVSGVFSESRIGNGTEAAPQFTCLIQLRGRLEPSAATFETWQTGGRVIPGRLVFSGDDTVVLTLEGQHDGCEATTGDMVGNPPELSLVHPGEGWIGVGLVTAARAVFHPAPGGPTPRTPYIVRSDVVAVLERRGGWVRALYLGGRRPVAGWLRAANLAADVPSRY